MTSTDDAHREFDQAVATKNALNTELADTPWLVVIEGRPGAYRFVAMRSLTAWPDIAAGATRVEAATVEQLRDQIDKATANDTPDEA